MDAFTNLIMGFQIALSPYNLMIATVGIILGTIIGVLPGLGGANGVALLLPVTFVMPPTSGIILLSCIYWGALFGGAITSILFNIPGEPWSVATTFDGHPMAKQGLGGQALTAAFMSSLLAWPLPAKNFLTDCKCASRTRTPRLRATNSVCQASPMSFRAVAGVVF